jgi:hypothetical protein
LIFNPNVWCRSRISKQCSLSKYIS